MCTGVITKVLIGEEFDMLDFFFFFNQTIIKCAFFQSSGPLLKNYCVGITSMMENNHTFL